jgi:hypothetical protein
MAGADFSKVWKIGGGFSKEWKKSFQWLESVNEPGTVKVV